MEPFLAQVTVTLKPDGSISLQCAGPQGANKLTLLGLLEMAKTAVQTPPKEQPPPLVLARGALPRGRG